MSDLPTPDDFLVRHRSALGLLARLQVPAWLRPKLDSSDLVQQTLLEAERDRGRLESMPESERAAYLRRCLSHNVIDAIRKFRPDQALANVERSSARIELWLAAEDSTPSERSAREDQLHRLAEALAALPEDQRTAVELKHLHGLSVREIAEQMGRTPSAVGGLLRRGVRELRERLGAIPGEIDAGNSA
jgi:RNA polymerase sigma-70 factor (ECF subfamily)